GNDFQNYILPSVLSDRRGWFGAPKRRQIERILPYFVMVAVGDRDEVVDLVAPHPDLDDQLAVSVDLGGGHVDPVITGLPVWCIAFGLQSAGADADEILVLLDAFGVFVPEK